jgi:hypothetical protein
MKIATQLMSLPDGAIGKVAHVPATEPDSVFHWSTSSRSVEVKLIRQGNITRSRYFSTFLIYRDQLHRKGQIQSGQRMITIKGDFV